MCIHLVLTSPLSLFTYPQKIRDAFPSNTTNGAQNGSWMSCCDIRMQNFFPSMSNLHVLKKLNTGLITNRILRNTWNLSVLVSNNLQRPTSLWSVSELERTVATEEQWRAQRLGNVQTHILKLKSGTHTKLIPISWSPQRECVISEKEGYQTKKENFKYWKNMFKASRKA